jgi:hypothetical protein
LIGADAPLRPTSFFSRLAHFAWHLPPWILQYFRTEASPWRRIWRWQKSVRMNLNKVLLPMTNWALPPLPRHLINLMEAYHPLPASNLEIDLFRERMSYRTVAHPLQQWQTSHLPDGGWSHWTQKPPRVHWVEGDHETILSPPAVSGLAQAILRAMDQHIRRSSFAPEKPVESAEVPA